MSAYPPTPDDVRALLHGFSHAEVIALADRAGMPFTTIWKIRQGDTPNPRLKTVCDLWPFLKAGPAALSKPARGSLANGSVDWVSILANLKRDGFTQQMLAALCGCTQSSISDLARGVNKSPSYDIGAELVKLAAHANESREAS